MNPVILTMGANHTTAPIHVRERIALGPCTRDEALGALHQALQRARFAESLLLSTCNRTELYAVVPDRATGERAMRQIFAGHETLGPSLANHLYMHADRDAVAHLFAVASGIDSMIVGESEILGQVRSAYLQAAKLNSVGPILHELCKSAIHVGKRAHSETAIGTGAASVAYAAVALARQHLGHLAGRRALVIGAGEMARKTAKNLAVDGVCTVMVTNRTFEHAAQLAKEIGGRAVQFDQLPDALADADLVVGATGAPHIILDAPTVQNAMARRPDRPLFVLDIAVPRDVDDQVANVPNVRLHNIDDLQKLVDANRAVREQAVEQVRDIIDQEVEQFWRWFVERRAAPVISDLYERGDAIRQAELDKALRRLGHLQLDERDRNVISALASGIVSKLLAAPTANLKDRVQSGDGAAYLETVRELFDLDSHED